MQTTETYTPGETIIQEGSEATCFYALEKGVVEVYVGETLLNVIMYPGSIIGEVAFVTKTARTATIRARAETTLHKYEPSSIEALIEQHPEVASKLIETLASRLARTTEKLTEISKFCS